MNWTKLSAVAEMVSSIAILLTLAYLAIQTQQNTAAIVSSSRQQALDSELGLIRMFVDYPEIGGAEFGADINDVRRNYVAISLFRIREHQWFQVQDGLLDEASFASYLQMLVRALKTDDSFRQRWAVAMQVGAYDPDFMARVNDELSRKAPRTE